MDDNTETQPLWSPEDDALIERAARTGMSCLADFGPMPAGALAHAIAQKDASFTRRVTNPKGSSTPARLAPARLIMSRRARALSANGLTGSTWIKVILVAMLAVFILDAFGFTGLLLFAVGGVLLSRGRKRTGKKHLPDVIALTQGSSYPAGSAVEQTILATLNAYGGLLTGRNLEAILKPSGYGQQTIADAVAALRKARRIREPFFLSPRNMVLDLPKLNPRKMTPPDHIPEDL